MIALELFGCSGGMAEGFRRAGIAFSFAFDRDPDACASYAANLGHRPVQVDVRDLVRMAAAGWSPGPVQLLVADPPCTPWSKAGKRRGLADERDMLVETCDLIRHLRPTSFLIGNIPGLDEGPGLSARRKTIGALAPAIGKAPLIYTMPSFARQYGLASWGDAPFELVQNRLWLAHWGVEVPDVPRPWNEWLIWQYSNKGRVPGIHGPVDLNRAKLALFDRCDGGGA